MRRRRAILIILAVIAVIALAFALGTYYTDRLLEPFIKDFLAENKPLKHRITYEKLRVNLAGRHVKIFGIRMEPDASLATREQVWMNVSVSSLRLDQFSISAFLFRKELIIGEIIFIEPSVVLHFPEKKPEAVREAAAESSAKTINLASFKGFSLAGIRLASGLFKLYRGEELLASSDELNFMARDIHVKRGQEAGQVQLEYGESRLSLANIFLHSSKGLYDIRIGGLQVSNTDSTLIMDGLKVIPKYGKKDFGGKLAYQDDRFDLSVSRIRVEQVGYQRWLNGLPLEISRLSLDGVAADIFRDKNVAFNTNRFPLFYNESFLKIPFEMIIDSMEISNSTVRYGELAEGSPEAWTIALEDFRLTAGSLRNFPDTSGGKMNMLLVVKANVMGEGPLNVELDLPLEGRLRDFRCKGSIGAMALAPLNPMLEPALNIRFKGGRMTRMTFDFTADDHNSSGWMEFLYQDLDVELLKKDSEKQRGFLSALANAVVMTSNPMPGKTEKIVQIGYERDKNKGIINYIWKTVQSGIVRTVVPVKKYQINKEVKRKDEKKHAAR